MRSWSAAGENLQVPQLITRKHSISWPLMAPMRGSVVYPPRTWHVRREAFRLAEIHRYFLAVPSKSRWNRKARSDVHEGTPQENLISRSPVMFLTVGF
ncbi:hypothetical protein FA15DRAFT_668029 [Coprinopsis marcescibilis]|uniref:Uncharacterized protein n=1 Tax=Coprinopsis marcescibilis TaxID=230819 RepID=A0A5C3KYZ6_COPMA|nr:hypothetical protein FA15DRAFT_668029 [Coprinopsis marcescibilis]